MNRTSARLATTSTIALVLILSGCAQEQARNQVHLDAQKAAEMAEVARRPAPFRDVSTVRHEPDGVYVGATARQKSTDRMLPSRLQNRQFSFIESKPLDFRSTLYLISTTTGLPVSYSAAVQRTASQVAGESRGAGSDSAEARQPRLAAGGPVPAGFDIGAAQALVAGGASASAPASDPTPPGRMKINYTGTLSGFLDSVASNYGVSWMSEGDRIIFSSQQTKVFDIPALPVVLKLSTSFSSQGASVQGGVGGGGGQSGGSSNDSVSTTTAVELWKDINSSLKSIVGGNGSIEISGATGTVTVNAPPDTMAQVSNYVREINRRLSKEIVMNLTVYSVNLSRSDRYSANINTILQNSKYGVAVSSAGSVAQTLTGAGGTYGGIPGQQGLGFTVLDGKFRGSNAVLEALSTAGEVSVVNSQSVTTMNGIPVPFRDVNTRGYAAQVSTSQPTGSNNSTPTTTITPGQVQTGYSMRMTPRVNNDGTILLEYALDLSELNGPQDGFRTFSTGGQTIQLPDINSRNTVNQATIPAGSTLVLSGLERTRTDAGRSGTGAPGNFLLGGSRNMQVTRELLVVAITPEIIDLGHGRSSR